MARLPPSPPWPPSLTSLPSPPSQRSPRRTLLRLLPALLTGALLVACASVKTARMALPAALAALPATPVQGIGSGRSGDFKVDDAGGSFRRGRDRLSVFDTVEFERTNTRYDFRAADGRSSSAACVGRQTTATLGALVGRPKPYTVDCRWTGAAPAQLTLAAPSWMPGTQATRNGRYSAEGLTLELQSVHRVQGSRLPLDTPIGYLITHDGQPVGAVELNGTVPRLWRPAAGSPLREPVTMAALALALLWDPADRTG